jgi:hypothetical protein
MDGSAHIKLLVDALAEFSPSQSVDGGVHRLAVTYEAKSVVVVWPQSLGEVYFDFLESGEVLLAESVEYYDEEPPAEQAQDIAQVVRNFLLNETRLVAVGRLLKRQELQHRNQGTWVSVFR